MTGSATPQDIFFILHILQHKVCILLLYFLSYREKADVYREHLPETGLKKGAMISCVKTWVVRVFRSTRFRFWYKP